MRSTQVTTWRKYTKREKQAYRARQARRHWFTRATGRTVEEWHAEARRHFFADNFGSRVPTARVNRDVL